MKKEFCLKKYYYPGRGKNFSSKSIQVSKLCYIKQSVLLNQNHMMRVEFVIFKKLLWLILKNGSFGILDYKCTLIQVPSLFLSGCWWFYVRWMLPCYYFSLSFSFYCIADCCHTRCILDLSTVFGAGDRCSTSDKKQAA